MAKQNQNNDQKLAEVIIAMFTKEKGRQPQNKEEITQYVQSKGGQEFINKLQQKLVQSAAHGAKLQYIKSLKHKCADDEELYYYKKGGSVGCGCRKKEDGGEVTKASKGCSAVEKFKAIRKGSIGYKNDEWTTYDPKLRKTRKMTPQEIAKAKKNQQDAREGKGEGDYIQPPANKSERVTRREEPEEPKVTRPKSINKPIKPIRRDTAKTSLQKCGGRVKKAECGVVAKFKAAKCGAKMKNKK